LAKVTVEFDSKDPAQVDDALATIGRLSPAPTKPVEHDTVVLHKRMPANASRRFVEALTDAPSTFKEIADRMAKQDGRQRNVDSMRAIYRNVRRREKTMRAAADISAPVVQSDFSGYDAEGRGRYYLDHDALIALNQYLGR
jgi:hypothetical protein